MSFRQPSTRRYAGTGFAFMTLLMLTAAGQSNGGMLAFSLILTAYGAAITVRAARAGAVYTRGRRVVVRNFGRTYTFDADEIACFTARRSSVGAYTRNVLFVTRTDGRRLKATDFNSPMKGPHANEVPDAVEKLNAFLACARPAAAPTPE